jgi:hypothetical protein
MQRNSNRPFTLSKIFRLALAFLFCSAANGQASVQLPGTDISDTSHGSAINEIVVIDAAVGHKQKMQIGPRRI